MNSCVQNWTEQHRTDWAAVQPLLPVRPGRRRHAVRSQHRRAGGGGGAGHQAARAAVAAPACRRTSVHPGHSQWQARRPAVLRCCNTLTAGCCPWQGTRCPPSPPPGSPPPPSSCPRSPPSSGSSTKPQTLIVNTTQSSKLTRGQLRNFLRHSNFRGLSTRVTGYCRALEL